MGSPYDPDKAAGEPLAPRKGAAEANARRLERREAREQEAARPRRKKGPVVLLVLLLVVGLGVAAILLAGSGDDGPTAAERAEAARLVAMRAEEDRQVMGPAELRTADGAPLVPPPEVVAPLIGDRVVARGVSVVDLTASGFFVTVGGTQETQGIGEAAGPAGRLDRVFVRSGERPARGERIDLRGRVRDVPTDVRGTLDLNAAEADVVLASGFYVAASR